LVEPNEAYGQNDNEPPSLEDDPHPAGYYTDQGTGKPHDDMYAHKAVAKRVYKCNKCSGVFPTKDQLNYHVHEDHHTPVGFMDLPPEIRFMIEVKLLVRSEPVGRHTITFGEVTGWLPPTTRFHIGVAKTWHVHP